MCACVCMHVCVDEVERVTIRAHVIEHLRQVRSCSTCFHVLNLQDSPRNQVLSEPGEVGHLLKFTVSGSDRPGTLLAPLRSLRAELWQSVS